MDIRVGNSVFIASWEIANEFTGSIQLIETCIFRTDPKITILVLVNFPYYISAE